MDSGCYNRHIKRRVLRHWNKIKVGTPSPSSLNVMACSKFSMFLYFEAVKVAEDVMCCYSIDVS